MKTKLKVSELQPIDVDVVQKQNGFVEINVNTCDYDVESKIDIRTPNSMYINVGDKVVYIDYSTDEFILKTWTQR